MKEEDFSDDDMALKLKAAVNSLPNETYLWADFPSLLRAHESLFAEFSSLKINTSWRIDCKKILNFDSSLLLAWIESRTTGCESTNLKRNFGSAPIRVINNKFKNKSSDTVDAASLIQADVLHCFKNLLCRAVEISCEDSKLLTELSNIVDSYMNSHTGTVMPNNLKPLSEADRDDKKASFVPEERQDKDEEMPGKPSSLQNDEDPSSEPDIYDKKASFVPKERQDQDEEMPGKPSSRQNDEDDAPKLPLDDSSLIRVKEEIADEANMVLAAVFDDRKEDQHEAIIGVLSVHSDEDFMMLDRIAKREADKENTLQMSLSGVRQIAVKLEDSDQYDVDPSKLEMLDAQETTEGYQKAAESSSGSMSTSENKSVVLWTHMSRGSTDVSKCFICKTDDVDKGQLEHCTKKYKAGTKCSTVFHMTCLKSYTAGRFSAEYLKTMVGHYQCPLHYCDSCWMDRRKSSAVVSNIVECDRCFRGFHQECLPAGLEIREEGRIKKTTCHSHFDLAKLTSKRGNISFCIECEQRIGKLKKCSKCIRAFHATCQEKYILKGDRFKQDVDVCDSCLYGESVKADQPVIVRYNNGMFAAVAVELSKYPKHCTPSDKYGRYLGKPGFVPVRWGGCKNLFSLMPANQVMPMFEGSRLLCRPTHKDKDFITCWDEAEANLQPIRPNFNITGEHYIKIKASVYHHETRQPRIVANTLDYFLCDCPADAKDRCGPNSKCSARGFQQECPHQCESNGKICNNRSVSKKLINPSMELREAEGKGHGVFATGLIKEGDFIAEYAGELLSNEEKDRRIQLSSTAQNDEEKHYMMTLDNTRVIDCKLKGNIARFLNHSCDPNCRIETVDVEVWSNSSTAKFDKRVRIVAIKDIQAEEELSFNYNMGEFSVGCPLPECRCNAPNCTGKLGPADTGKKKNAPKYRPPAVAVKVEMDNGESEAIVRPKIKQEAVDPYDSNFGEANEAQNIAIKSRKRSARTIAGTRVAKVSKIKQEDSKASDTTNGVISNLERTLDPTLKQESLRRSVRKRGTNSAEEVIGGSGDGGQDVTSDVHQKSPEIATAVENVDPVPASIDIIGSNRPVSVSDQRSELPRSQNFLHRPMRNRKKTTSASIGGDSEESTAQSVTGDGCKSDSAIPRGNILLFTQGSPKSPLKQMN